MKRAIALMLIFSLLVFGLATTANALIVFGEDCPADEATPDEVPQDEEPGIDGEEVAADATPDFNGDEFPAESGGWMK